MAPSYRFGIDLGGTKIEIVALDQDGEIQLRQRVATPVGKYMATLQAISDLVKQAEQSLDVDPSVCSVGIGMPGALSHATGRVKNSNSVCLIDKDIKRDLEALLEREIRIENDANCLALSESVDGAASGAKVVFAVILGTGVGGGIAINQQCLTGINSIAGEWGHNPLPWPDEKELADAAECYCGKNGCIETWLSGKGLSRSYEKAGYSTRTAKEISLMLKQGDQNMIKIFQLYIRRLAKSLASVINVLDPDVIVLGGGLSNIPMLYEGVPAVWGEYVFSDQVRTQLLQSQHGDSSGVRGAAWLWY